MAAKKRSASVIDELEQFALSLPEAWADSPWGDRVVKVAKKIFVFLSSADSAEPGMTVKLPQSRDHGLSFEGATLPGYGLGKSGWVTIRVDGVPKEEQDVLFDFIEESYRTIAPTKLVKQLDEHAG
jgi:predicted DNA-binding protein (MmcQ/YjbR family)